MGSGMASINGVRAFRVLVQSNFDADFVESRIRAFLASVEGCVLFSSVRFRPPRISHLAAHDRELCAIMRSF